MLGGDAALDGLPVRVRVCTDEQMRDTVIDSFTQAPAEDGHSVHFSARNLEPGREYWYQFYFGEDESPIGRTRTAPAPDSDESMSVALVCCQHYETGHFAAYEDMAASHPDLVVHVGDYIYEYAGIAGRVREHVGEEIRTLWDYRNRYALYKLDPHLQAAHAASPWIVSPDDHEIDNNWAGYIPQDPEQQTEMEFKVRRWAALKAFYEHMPIENRPQLDGLDSSLRIYSGYDFGRQLRINLMDTRQYRSDQPCGQVMPADDDCDGRYNNDTSMMGNERELWLGRQLRGSRERWNVLAQQTWFSRFRYPNNQYNMDQWDGYVSDQNRLLQRLSDPELSNPVVLSGDWHCGCAMDITESFDDPESTPVAAELASTSISSACRWAPAVEAALPENPQVQYYSGDRRGYVWCNFDEDRLQAEYRLVEDSSSPDSSVSVDKELQVLTGVRGFSS